MQPWKQGDTAESHAEGGAITVAESHTEGRAITIASLFPHAGISS